MDKHAYASVVFENAAGIRTVLSDENVKTHWELRGRSGFSAPEVELVTQKYADGTTKVLTRQIKPRPITLNMVVTGKTKAQRDALFFQMINQLMDVSGGEVGKLYLRRSDGVTVYLNCAYTSGLAVTEEYRLFHKFTLEFFAADAYFYRDLPEATIELPAESKITLRDFLLLGAGHVLGETTGEGYGIIRNNGYESILPVIKAKRVSGNFTITNQTTNQTLIVSGITISPDEWLVIDCRPSTKSIKIIHADGSESAAGQYLDWSNIDMIFELVHGDNEITFNAGVGSYTEGITLEMSERYLSA